jgi:hypothetical protein
MSEPPRTATKFAVRAFCIPFGAMLMFVSGYGIWHGIFWVPQFNYRYGERGTASLGILLLFAALLFSIGVFARDLLTKNQSAGVAET